MTGARLRYLPFEEGEQECVHCDADIEIPFIDKPLFEVELDAQGFNRDWTDPDLDSMTSECECCGGVIVYGMSEGGKPYAVRGRSKTDLRYLAERCL